MGAILTNSVHNFIAGSKNISTTHISNGAYRYHPVEWNIGESAGALAAYAIITKQLPKQILDNKGMLHRFQIELLTCGIPLYWYDDVPIEHKAFVPIQLLSLEGIIHGAASHLHFKPDEIISNVLSDQWIRRAKIRYGLKKSMLSDFQERMHNTTKAQFATALFEVVQPLIIEG
jgi:hypothetical protein